MVHTREVSLTCRIKVRGYLESSWSDRLGGLTITTTSEGEGSTVTTLYGQLVDEAALAGVLSTLYDLGFSLVSVNRIESGDDEKTETTD